MNRISNYISVFIEKHTSHIQLLFLLLILVVGILFPVINIDIQTIILNLILIVGIEILLIIIKNDTLQNKIDSYLSNSVLNENTVYISIDEDPKIFPQMLSEVNHDLFISGITCNNIWTYTSKIKEILHKDFEVKILVTSEDGFQINTLIYKGNDLDESIQNTKNKIKLLINNIISDNQLKSYFENNKLIIKTTRIPFTVGYVAIDIYDNNTQKQKIKVTQYIPKYERVKCPNIIVDSINNNKLFTYYNNIIKDLWETSEPLNIKF